MNRVKALALGIGVALVALDQMAWADVVDRPPSNCPDGSHGQTGHAGPYCQPSSCTNDAECESFGSDLVCKEQSLCIEKKSYTDWSNQTYTRDEVKGVCTQPADCTAPAICTAGKRCVPSASGTGTGGGGGGATSGGEDKVVESGCGCAVPAGRGPTAALVLAALAVCAAAMRRTSVRA